MPIRFFALLLCCTIHMVAIAQTVFAPMNARWNFVSTKDFGDEAKLFQKYEMEKDTLYFGQLCSKIVGKTIKVDFSGMIVDTTYEPPFYTYVNGDTVFYYNDSFGHFYPLYIFNVHAGQLVQYHVPYRIAGRSDTAFSVFIDSVKVILVDGQPSRMIFSHPAFGSLFGMNRVVERLGPLYSNYKYSIRGHYEYIPLSAGGQLRCYQDQIIDTVLDDGLKDCDSIDAVGIPSIDKKEAVYVGPNPVLDKLRIGLPADQFHRCQLTVLDGLGNIRLFVPQLYQPDVMLDFTGFTSGVYFLRIADADQQEANSRIYRLIKN